MRSNVLSIGIHATLALVVSCLLMSCGADLGLSTGGDDFVIGEKVQTSSSLSDPNATSDRTQVVLFDKTVRVIHHFDMAQMKVKKTLTVSRPDEQHAVLFDQSSGLIVDLSGGHVTLYDRDGTASEDPITFSGKAVSTAFRPALGTLVIYDEMSTVGILKFDGFGHVVKRWVGGPLLGGSTGATITAGDLNDQDQLILALSDGSIATVDVAATVTGADGNWVFTKVASGLTKIRWVAPVRGTADKIMTLSGPISAPIVSLVSTTTGAVVDQKTVESIDVFSKGKDPHIVTRGYHQVELTYATPTSLESRTLSADISYVASSRLCLSENSWSFVDAKQSYSWTYNAFENELASRNLRKYRLSDMMALKQKALPDQAQLDISSSYIFALYPSELGRADRLGINDDSKSQITKFNLGYIRSQ